MQDNRLLNWIIQRGITPAVIEQFELDVYDHPFIGSCIRIPVQGGNFNKYRRDPVQDIKPKYLYDKGSKAFLYGSPYIADCSTVLITEGELDTLVAWSNNIPAVTSTGGANTFLQEWAEILQEKKIYICFDNDEAGAVGMVKVLKLIPDAYVVLIPDRPNIKDITDYVQYGGNLADLLKTGRQYLSIDDIKDDMSRRVSVFESIKFHEAYLEEHTPKAIPNSYYQAKDNTDVERVKTYPISKLIEFKQKKAPCIWHNEKTPSMAYYPNTNTVYCFGCGKHGDVIDVFEQIHQVGFKEALNELKKLV
jgi:DNA primase